MGVSVVWIVLCFILFANKTFTQKHLDWALTDPQSPMHSASHFAQHTYAQHHIPNRANIYIYWQNKTIYVNVTRSIFVLRFYVVWSLVISCVPQHGHSICKVYSCSVRFLCRFNLYSGLPFKISRGCLSFAHKGHISCSVIVEGEIYWRIFIRTQGTIQPSSAQCSPPHPPPSPPPSLNPSSKCHMWIVWFTILL